MPISDRPLPNVDDATCEGILGGSDLWDETTRALAGEVLAYRAMARALLAVVERHDHDTVGQSVASFSLITPGEIAEVLHLTERAIQAQKGTR